MSVPQQKIFDDNNLKYFIRISEIEKNFIMSKAKGDWVDSFFKIWYNEKILKKISIVVW